MRQVINTQPVTNHRRIVMQATTVPPEKIEVTLPIFKPERIVQTSQPKD